MHTFFVKNLKTLASINAFTKAHTHTHTHRHVRFHLKKWKWPSDLRKERSGGHRKTSPSKQNKFYSKRIYSRVIWQIYSSRYERDTLYTYTHACLYSTHTFYQEKSIHREQMVLSLTSALSGVMAVSLPFYWSLPYCEALFKSASPRNDSVTNRVECIER